MKNLLILSVEEVYGKDFKKLFNMCNSHQFVFSKLPKYCCSNRTRTIQESYHYHQFFESYDDFDSFILFDVAYAEPVLSDMISDAGLGEVFKKFDFNKTILAGGPYNRFSSIDYASQLKLNIEFDITDEEIVIDNVYILTNL